MQIMHSIRVVASAAVFFTVTLAGCQKPAAGTVHVIMDQPARQGLPTKPSLILAVKIADDGAVQFTVTTNLPTPLAAMASLDLQGLRPQDTAIGTSHRVTLNQATTTFYVKAINDDNGLDGKALPMGQYDAEVIVGPKWVENKSISTLPDILRAKQSIWLRSNRSQTAVKRMGELQGWVIENVPMDAPWDEARFVTKLGHYEKTQSDRSPYTDAYYFPDADMTLIVNHIQEKVLIWRVGVATGNVSFS
jgi:hypothetical protein